MPRKKRENKLYTLDTETIGLGGDIKRIAIYDGEKLHYGYTFQDVEPVLDAAYKAGYMPHIAIHNLEFDARKIGIFRPGNVNWNKTVLINDKYARITCKHYVLHDSYKILPMSLAKLSGKKGFDLEHGKLDLWDEVQKTYPQEYTDHVDFLTRCDPDDPLYVKYLGFDTIALYELMEKLLEVSGLTLDEMLGRVSTASLSKYLLKNGYKGEIFKGENERKTDYEHLTSFKSWSSNKPFPGYTPQEGEDPITYLQLEGKIREAYYGGRTEVFTPQVIGGRAYHFDVNSLYPSVFDREYPVSNPEFYNDPDIVEGYWNMWRTSRAGLGFIKAKVFVPLQHIPPLPAKMGKLVFPSGHIRGTWAFHELEYAIDNCGVRVEQFEEIILFRHTFPVFKRFLKTFYTLKEDGKRTGNAALTTFAKLILNTAYGWTALSREGKTELKNLDKMEKYEDRINYVDEELEFINIDSVVVSDSVQVPVAAYVTAYARLVLLDMLRKMDAAGTVYYCDTDSIVCSRRLPPEDVDPYQLGKWDLEAVLKDGIFLFPKVYWEQKDGGENIKFKGVSSDADELKRGRRFYADTLYKLQHGKKDKIIVERGREILRSVLYTQKRGLDINTVETRDKKINLANVQKRDMDYKNNCSLPWHFESLHEFENFTFAEPIKKWEEHGNLFDPMSRPPKR